MIYKTERWESTCLITEKPTPVREIFSTFVVVAEFTCHKSVGYGEMALQ
ncbi:MAG: hypothetical protein ACI9UO_001787 [Nitrospinales bacterium]|jgi:hypothetical protein